MKLTCHLLIFLLVMVCIAQFIFIVSSMLGGRESRLYLMGMFSLSPFAVLVCLTTGIALTFSPETASYRKSYSWIVVAILIGQIVMLGFG